MPSVILLSLATIFADSGPVQHGLRVPPGFEVTEFSDSKLADDVYCMTLDPRGRVVVSGRGYVRILVDDDGDGRADRALELAAGPKDGAMGLLWEGDSLFVSGDGGLRRHRVARDGNRAEGPSELIRAFKTGGEHQAHALRRGPDGWLYLLGGDGTGFDRATATLPTSPIRDPMGGCVIRFPPDFRGSEIVADGFRNAYAMDFNADGELFTFDSDNERCVSLPWYEPIRFYHVPDGGHHGWLAPQRASWWRLPPYLMDVVRPIATLGRGSPTGVACYRHLQFPEKYRGGFFLLDWTFGRVYFCKLRRAGASYACTPEVFLESVGDNGFAPTAVVVHPTTGDLFVSIGGRGTRGGVYRIRYPRGLHRFDPAEIAALQPRWRSLDWNPATKPSVLRDASSSDFPTRARALGTARRHHDRFTAAELTNLIRANAGMADRSLRRQAADLATLLDARDRVALAVIAWASLDSRPPGRDIATLDLAAVVNDPATVLRDAAGMLNSRPISPEVGLCAARLLQLALGDLVTPDLRDQVWAGYSPRLPERARAHAAAATAAVAAAFPTGHADLDRELSRVLAMVESDHPVLLEKVAARLTTDSSPVEDFHYLTVLGRMQGPRSQALTRRTADSLIALDRKAVALRLHRERHWSLRLAELYAGLVRNDPALNGAVVDHPEFGRPDHALFALATGFDGPRAARAFLARAAKEPDYAWSAEAVEVLGALPPGESRPALCRLWGKAGLDDVILPILARTPVADDRAKYLEAVGSPQLATAHLGLEALEKLTTPGAASELLPLIVAHRRLSEVPGEKRLREQIGRYLRKVTGAQLAAADRNAWSAWLARAHPDLAPRLAGRDGVDAQAWSQRLSRVDWSGGDPARGQQVFQKASCAACHAGTRALGPDLHGVAGRFSRDDLFTAILQPSKDVSPRYRATLITTEDGKVYQGMIVYEAMDGILLQTGPAATVRIPGDKIANRRLSDVSLMPTGLLDKLSNAEIADLYAYLRSMTQAAAASR
jgi:putative heme-binding domain-containing protein